MAPAGCHAVFRLGSPQRQTHSFLPCEIRPAGWAIRNQNAAQKGLAATPVAPPGKPQTKQKSCLLGQICETLGVVAIPVPAANGGTTPGAAPVHVKAEGVLT
jgi:hypothetical protein